jgi:glycosyltransferase involved in cell wall biosynthesis
MPEIKKGIFIINCLMEPPFGGISKYLTYSLPKIAKDIPIFGITQRGYENFGNKEANEENFKTKLIKGKYLGMLLLPFIMLRYLRFTTNLLFKYKIPVVEVARTVYFWFPETENYLKRNLSEIKYIHVYSKPYSSGAIGMYLSKKYNLPMLITTFGELVPHKDEIERLDEYSEQFKPLTKAVLTHCLKISSPTKYCQSILSEYDIDIAKVELTYHVCDIEKFTTNIDKHSNIMQRYPQLLGKRCILFVGHMFKRKAPNLILEAAAQIEDLDKNLVFVFIGPDFGFYDELKQISKDTGLYEQCLFPGIVSQEDLFEFYSFADMFIFTTISNIECLGLVFVQAMLSNCAVIASNISGVPEVINHGENGLLFEPGNVEELSENMKRFLNDEEYKNKLMLTAKSSASEQFAENIVLDQILKFYE